LGRSFGFVHDLGYIIGDRTEISTLDVGVDIDGRLDVPMADHRSLGPRA
jgi:hypothetical protein